LLLAKFLSFISHLLAPFAYGMLFVLVFALKRDDLRDVRLRVLRVTSLLSSYSLVSVTG